MPDVFQVNFRMPAALKQALQDAADRSNRTLTAEIVHRLEQSLQQPAPVEPTDLGKLRDEMASMRRMIEAATSMLQGEADRSRKGKE